MSLDYSHHCPVCGKKGNRRCIKLRHIVECDTHKGRFHSKFHDCVACAEARAREERAMKDAEDDDQSTDSDGKQGQKREKKGKIKRPQEKSMKKLRREKRQARTSSSSTTA